MSLDGRVWCRQVKPTRCVHRGGWAGGLFSLLSSGVTYLSILYMGVSVSELTSALFTISAMLGAHRLLLLLRSQHLSGGKLSLICRYSLATPNSLLSPSHRGISLLHVRNPFYWLQGIMKRPLPFFFFFLNKEFIKSRRDLSVYSFRLRINLKQKFCEDFGREKQNKFETETTTHRDSITY